jgi:hypothetical protein
MLEENGEDEDLLVVFNTNSDTRDWIADITSECLTDWRSMFSR